LVQFWYFNASDFSAMKQGKSANDFSFQKSGLLTTRKPCLVSDRIFALKQNGKNYEN